MDTPTKTPKPADSRAALRGMTENELALLGVEQVAFIKPAALSGGRTGFAVYTADGLEAAVLEDEASALATIYDNDLEPVTLN